MDRARALLTKYTNWMATAASNDVSKRPGPPAAYRFPPGFQRNLLWFAFRRFRPANPILLFQHLASEYGDIAHYKIGWNHIVFLNHPDYIREILVVQNDNFIKERTVRRTKMLLGDGMITAEGAQHRSQRQVAQPAFHRQRIPEYANMMVQEAARTRDRWRAGEQRDIAIDMMHLTLNVVAQTLFATELRDEVDELASAINRIMSLYNFLVMLPAAEWLVHARPPGLAAFVRARKRIDAVVYRMIAAHRRRDAHGGSLLDLMLAASPDQGSPDQSAASEQSLRDQVITIFLAGYETVANALSWTWYLLSQNPECERRFHDEIDRELEGRLPTFDDIPAPALRGHGAGRIHAPLPTRLGDGPLRARRFSLGRFFPACENDSINEPVHHPTRSQVFSRSTALRSRTLHARSPLAPHQAHLLPLRRRRKAMHRRIVLSDGRRAASDRAGAKVEIETSPRALGRARAA